MDLTRRDALAALAAAGVAVGGGAALRSLADPAPDGEASQDDRPIDDEAVSTLVAAAEVLYPSAVGEIETFVTRYVSGRAGDRPAYVREMARSAGYLDEWTRAWYDEGFDELDRPTRDEVLRRINADTAAPDPEGSDVERVRYYLVNELLFALYATPTGGQLVGIENPQGYPGGLSSYQRGSPDG